ncbi:MAG: bifunctional riboflavin kinase/FAD synthetase [Egibacteraceae bacterium]
MAEAGRIVAGLDEIDKAPSVVSIGFFDGVHRGHQAIITQAARRAQEFGVRSAVVTFDRHPMEVVNPGTQPKLLMTLARRAQTIAAQGIDLVVVLEFSDWLRHLKPPSFIDHVLVGPLQARRVVVGSNFRFGHKAAGDVATLTALGSALGPDLGFGVEGATLLQTDGVVISSSQIRGALDDGDVEWASRMLGRPHLVEGIVVRGDARGKSLGFPTANLQTSRRVAIPARGVYAGVFHLPDGTPRPCATNVGVNPTFGGQELRVESFLLDWSGDLYGAAVAVDFRHRLRDEIRFDSVDALITQMSADVARTRHLLNTEDAPE